MAGNPINEIYVDGLPVAKGDVRSYGSTRSPVIMADLAEVRSRDLSALTLIYAAGFFYRKDSADTTSPDDGVTVIVDNAGTRFHRVLPAAVEFDARGDVTNSPSDRDAYDDEAQGFTFFSLAEGGYYYKLSAASADWSSLISLAAEVPDDAVTSDDVGSIVTLTQSAYDALDPPDAGTLYVIVEE